LLAALAILSATLALSLSFLIADKASRLGFAVAIRFLERGDVIPPGNLPLTAENLDRWRSEPANRASAQGYASQIMSWDIAFLLSFGCFFGFGSMALASQIPMLSPYRCLFWIFPALYIASDFIEDLLIRHVLLSPSLQEGHFVFMRRMTWVKMRSSLVCFGLIIVLSVWAMLH
jgi:hypothetical protein